MSKKCKKLFLLELVRQFSNIEKRNQKISWKNFDENLEKFKFCAIYMEKHAAKCKNQNFLSKLSLL